MRAVLPGKPQAKLQAVSTAQWHGRCIVVYISGTALVVLAGPDQLLQTIYHDEDERLDAVALDEVSGKIAASSGRKVFVYRPYGEDEGALKWSLQCSLAVDDGHDTPLSLSWGASEELLAAGSSLTLLSTAQTESELWSRKLANPAKFARFSHDATLVASTGQYDRLVKLWRRLSFGSDDVRFDFTYLPHPTAVTNMHWRRPHHREQTMDNILYTTCADNVLRIWAPMDPHGLQILQLWAQVDLQESIKPRLSALAEPSLKRYVFIIDGRDFTAATECAVQRANPRDATDDHALDHLVEVARRSPEVCVVLDEQGRMSAWGLENVGCRARKTTNIFNIAHVEGVRLHLKPDATPHEDYVQFQNFCGDSAGSNFTVLAHHFDGRIEWLEGGMDELFDPSPRRQRLRSKGVWSGHAGSIKKIDRTASGNALVSRTTINESVLWKQKPLGTGTTLVRQSEIHEPAHIRKMCVLDEGNLVVVLHEESIALWDTRADTAIRTVSRTYSLKGRALCLISLPSATANPSVAHIATISSEMKGITWEVALPSRAPHQGINGVDSSAQLREFCTFDLGERDDLAFVLPVDPAGSVPFISGFVDTFARDVAISCSHSGVLHSWTAKVDPQGSTVHWLLTSSVETAIEKPSRASGSSIRKTALVDEQGTGLTIWDTRGAQLEFDRRFTAQDVIQDLDWTSTPDDQSILAVGSPHRVLLLSQLRYDYLNAGPAWAVIREIRIRDLTPHPIGDSIWLDSGNFVVGAGNQLFVYDKHVDITDHLVTDLSLPSHEGASNDIFDVVARLNGPLPVFHPQFLSHCVLRGRLPLAQKILVALHKSLKFLSEGDKLDSFLGLPVDLFYRDDAELSNSARKGMGSFYSDFLDDGDSGDVVTESLAAALNEKLTKTAVPRLSGAEQIHLADIVECCATVERHRRSMDENASCYLLFFRQHILRKAQQGVGQVMISWREISWAYHSNSQDMLIDLVSRQFQGRMLWEHARETGMFMWIKDAPALRAQFEIIARNQYTRTDEKNPIDCTLFYLALRKKSVLTGLWRMASWNREQRSTQKLLANDFRESRWKTAALKNAYVLLGKHRFEYAAAFFLLADCLKDAVNVCINQLDDLQLAIAVARVYGGDDGPVLREMLQERVLPQAARDGNRWLATWAFWMLSRRDLAVRALISPVHTLLESPESPGMQAKSFLADDPALVMFYQQLREKSLQTLRGASRISPRAEWDFIMHNARLYDRMGCDLLALHLVRNWEFLVQPPEREKSLEQAAPDPRKMLRRRSSLVVADLPTSPRLPDMKSGSTKPPPSVFEEPDANSLLNSFGF
ncbi:MAG: regulator of (H+)-ATPase in vacuolar membrane [Thelocarpon impressellum]|nr:MAG: regulator of (H+)-ATPase in vacuolar membrane [Thelocarpon impressellum]